MSDVDTPDGLPAHESPLNDADEPPPHLIELAHAHDVATEFWDWRGEHTLVPTRTLRAVLRALDVDARTHEAVERGLAAARDRDWHRVLAPVQVVRRASRAMLTAHVPTGSLRDVRVHLEDGAQRRLDRSPDWVEPRVVDGRRVEELTFLVPDDLPLGWHTVRAYLDDGDASGVLVVTPERLQLPPALADFRSWGFMVQLYSVRSRLSWGLGDLADLSEIASWSARQHHAGFVLVNPLHAAEPVSPMSASPYLPTTRRFVNPVYLRVEDIPEVGYMRATDRAVLEWQAEAMRALNTDPGELDRDSVWAAKRSALERVFAQRRRPSRQAAFQAYCEQEGVGLRDFATWCALAECYGAQTSSWPAGVRNLRGEAVAEFREELADRIDFHMWLQWCLDEQLAAAQRGARAAGMPVGVVHDLAVGVHPDGADSWALSDVLAHDVTVGAPPDAFNQQGQNWSQPPWRPDRLADLGYAPYRDMIRTILRHAGGVRIDHILGLFRLWWVPRDAVPSAGTYVRYDHEALIGILALEAHRAGALVVGEDLGTVEPWVRAYLRERGILGTSILWFERDDEGKPLRPQMWRELCLATVTTHDLPPTAGYLAGEHLERRERLGLLTRSVEEETAADEADRLAVLRQLRDLGLLGDDATERDKVEALHRFLTWTPAKLLGVSLADAIGERRTMNQPGTYKEYPNWCLPLADGVGQPVLLDDIMTSLRVTALARALESR